MTGEPEAVPPLARVVMPDVEQHGYRAYPLVDHVADKVAAMFERHGGANVPSTRYKDLVDIVTIVISASTDAEPQLTALRSEAAWHHPAGAFQCSRPSAVGARLRGGGGRSLLPVAHTLDDALATVTPFLDPLLDGSAAGTWDSDHRRWTT